MDHTGWKGGIIAQPDGRHNQTLDAPDRLKRIMRRCHRSATNSPYFVLRRLRKTFASCGVKQSRASEFHYAVVDTFINDSSKPNNFWKSFRLCKPERFSPMFTGDVLWKAVIFPIIFRILGIVSPTPTAWSKVFRSMAADKWCH